MRVSKLITSVIIVSSFIFGKVFAQGSELSNDPFSFGFLGYLSYQGKIDKGEFKDNSFQVNRSYFTVKKNIFSWLSGRLTLDSYQDASGNMNMRIKYFYANFKFGDFLFFTQPNIEAGIAHTPWLDFEEAINTNRMQGSMFMERNGLFSSADFGATFFSNFGGEMDNDYKKNVDGAYAGRYGSIALGVYNGGGYNQPERNYQKPLEARVSLRPIPDVIPGLQISYFGAFGNGNQVQDTTPAWTTNALMLSFESAPLVVTAQYVTGQGNASGSLIQSKGVAAPVDGLSVFAMGRIDKWRIIGRYDNFLPNKNNTNVVNQRAIVGLGYDLGHSNILLLDFDKGFNKDKSKADQNFVKLTMQVNY